MSTKVLSVDDLLELAAHLSVLDKVNLVERLMARVAHELHETPPTSRRSLFGLLADLGPAPSDEDIAEARREMWGNVGEGDDY